mgnify:CR=1 FL=1
MEKDKQFVVERIKKLVIPFVFGLLVLVPIMTYTAEVFFNGYTGTYWQQYELFFTKDTDLTGYHGGFTPAHLWFLLYLFVISLTALLIVRLQKKRFPKFRVGSLSYFLIILLFVPEWFCLYVLNIGGKSLGQFMILFLFGYYIFSEESILQKLQQYRFVSLAFCILSGSLYTYFIDCIDFIYWDVFNMWNRKENTCFTVFTRNEEAGIMKMFSFIWTNKLKFIENVSKEFSNEK